MSAEKEMKTLELWACDLWRYAAREDGCNWSYSQWGEWRVARNWLWGFATAAQSVEAREAADFLADIAIIRGSLP